jgi:ABC-type nitrate/sulfonate/bicarbonate transport system permease component
LLASVLGVLLGALIASSELVHRMTHPLLEFMRPLPASAIIPVAILAFGLSSTMSTAVIAFGSIWPVLLASVQGFASVDQRLREVASVMRLNTLERFAKIQLPSALPGILAGARVGLSVALILAVVTEMQASLSGIGQNILMAQRSFKTPDLYAGVVVLGVIGFVTSAAIQAVENRLLRWRSDAR